MEKIIQFSHKELKDTIKLHVLPLLNQYRIFALVGPLGVGKTTLIKELFKQCGVNSVITSPTFGYVNTYHGEGSKNLHHFDLYRLNSLHDFIAAGFDELLEQKDSYCFIEWPGIINQLLTTPTLKSQTCFIILEYANNNPEERFLNIIR